MNIKFWMAGFLVIPKVYAVIASPFSVSSFVVTFSVQMAKCTVFWGAKFNCFEIVGS